MKNRILHLIHVVLWAVYWRMALRIGERDPQFPKFAWTNKRPGLTKLGNWIMDLDPYAKE